MKVSKLKYNPNNPRRISEIQLERLTKSIKDFPEMMELRPMVYDPETMQILGGNQRLAAIRKLGMKEIPDTWAIPANKLTAQQKKEFVLRDNVQYGEWDFEILNNSFLDFDFDDIGIDVPSPVEKQDISEKGKPIKPIKKVHYLISIPIDSVLSAKDIINKLKSIDGIEIEQSQN